MEASTVPENLQENVENVHGKDSNIAEREEADEGAMIDQLFNLKLDQAITDMGEPDTEIDTTTAVVMLTVSSPTNEPGSESKGIQDEDKGEVLLSEIPDNEDDDKECSKEASQDDERLIPNVAEENITKEISGGESTDYSKYGYPQCRKQLHIPLYHVSCVPMSEKPHESML